MIGSTERSGCTLTKLGRIIKPRLETVQGCCSFWQLPSVRFMRGGGVVVLWIRNRRYWSQWQSLFGFIVGYLVVLVPVLTSSRIPGAKEVVAGFDRFPHWSQSLLFLVAVITFAASIIEPLNGHIWRNGMLAVLAFVAIDVFLVQLPHEASRIGRCGALGYPTRSQAPKVSGDEFAPRFVTDFIRLSPSVSQPTTPPRPDAKIWTLMGKHDGQLILYNPSNRTTTSIPMRAFAYVNAATVRSHLKPNPHCQ